MVHEPPARLPRPKLFEYLRPPPCTSSRRASSQRKANIHDIVMLDPGGTKDFAAPSCDSRLNPSASGLLTAWLASNADNRLLVIAGVYTQPERLEAPPRPSGPAPWPRTAAVVHGFRTRIAGRTPHPAAAGAAPHVTDPGNHGAAAPAAPKNGDNVADPFVFDQVGNNGAHEQPGLDMTAP
jgi:hypothetical protein